MTADPPPTRPTTFEEYRVRIARMVTEAGLLGGLAFRPRATDVVIAPFAKCGTTWLQQVLHTLRTGGDMDFDDISRVVPWIEMAHDLGQDLDAPQRAEPRLYKSHLPWDLVPKGARYVVALRDPADALISMYRFMEGWFFEPGTVSLEAFALGHFLARDRMPDYWTHLASWWPRRRDEHVLLLTYEEMKRDLPGVVRRVADFGGIPLDARLLARTVEHASLDFMLAHKDKFDDLLMRQRSEQVAGLPPGSDSAKVRTGASASERPRISAVVSAALERTWRDQIEARFGFPDYVALAAALAADG